MVHVGVPFRDQVFVVAVNIGGVPESTPGLVNGIENL